MTKLANLVRFGLRRIREIERARPLYAPVGTVIPRHYDLKCFIQPHQELFIRASFDKNQRIALQCWHLSRRRTVYMS